MDVIELKRKEEAEIAKTRLNDLEQMITETMSRTSKLESEFEEAKTQRFKRLANLQSIGGNQYFKLTKLNTDLKNLKEMLLKRTDEKNELVKINQELKDELSAAEAAMTNLICRFHLTVEELETSIKKGYMQLSNDKDMELILEVGMSSLKGEEQVPFIEEVLRKRNETQKRRQEDLKNRLTSLEEDQQRAERDIQYKKEKLEDLQEKYKRLVEIYNMSKKVKEVAKEPLIPAISRQ